MNIETSLADPYIQALLPKHPLEMHGGDLSRLILVVEKYSREHIAGHLESPPVCLFNAGSERDVLLEDELWAEDTPPELIHATARLLWALGFEANHPD